MIGALDTKNLSDDAIVLYHANCNDGFGAAWAFDQLAPYSSRKITLKGVSYGEAIEHILNLDEDNSKRDVWILDFSFPANDLIALAERFNQVVVIDHHKTAIEGIFEPLGLNEQYQVPDNLHIVWDLHRSGAGLTWDYLFHTFTPPKADYSRPQLINYIEDRDLWKHKLPDTKEISAVISATSKTIKDYNELSYALRWEYSAIVYAGRLLLGQYTQMVEDIVKLASPCTIYDATGNKHEGLCANCTGQFASDVGSHLAKISGTFGGTYYSAADRSTKFSLRSFGDYDVSAICKTYGGGGHKNAAGFTLSAPSPEVNGVTIWGADIVLPQGGM